MAEKDPSESADISKRLTESPVTPASSASESLQSATTPPGNVRNEDLDRSGHCGPSPGAAGLSKNQQKKLKRRQRWEDGRPARKARRKEKRKAVKERKREAVQNGSLPSDARNQPRDKQTPVPMTILIDCQFEDLMTPEEQVSMANQLTRCYADRKKARYKPFLAVSSYRGFLQDRFEGILDNQHRSWDVKFRSHHFTEVTAEAREWMKDFKDGHSTSSLSSKESSADTAKIMSEPDSGDGEIIYLSSESPDTLHSLKPYSTYIIGGIVDKNRHKGVCYQRARDHDIKTAKLPIGDYIEMSSRQVLTTNHVHEIMIKWLELEDWGQAFMSVIPPRKGGVLKSKLSEPDKKDSVSIDTRSTVDDSRDAASHQDHEGVVSDFSKVSADVEPQERIDQ